MLRLREPEPAFNTTRDRAAQLFAESVVCGFVLGAVAAFVGVLIALGVAVAANSGDSPLAYLWYLPGYVAIAAGFGGAAGMFIGLLTGGFGLMVVRIVEPRRGATVVAWLLLLGALAVVLPIAIAVAAPGVAWWRALVLSVALALTVIGTGIVAARYLRRAEWASVH